MKLRMLVIYLSLALAPGLARADPIAIGLLSFDVFIPSSITPPITGINAFDVFNFTGPTFGGLLGSPYASDPLTFENASLTVTPANGPSQVFSLGDIGPGELLDKNGNPPVEFPAAANFTSATFTATLSPADFRVSDGTTFDAFASVSATLTPSSGSFLQAGVDVVVINAQASQTAEPSTLALAGTALTVMFYLFARKPRYRQRTWTCRGADSKPPS
jgi:hypothetical protein